MIAKQPSILQGHFMMNDVFGFQELVLTVLLLLISGGPIGALKMLLMFVVVGFRAV